MIKPFFHNSITIALAGLVFFATTSFTLDMHFCEETLVDFSLIHVVQTCGMERNNPKRNVQMKFRNSTAVQINR